MKLERKHIVMCSVSGFILIGLIVNIVLAGMVELVAIVEEPQVTPLPEGSVIYLPGTMQESARLVYQGQESTSCKRIALTFDSGWIYEYTPALLDILSEAGVVATFFNRGKWAEANPDLLKRMVKEGHLIGNHSYTHPYMDKLSLAEVAKEIAQASIVLEELAGYKPWLYRPPYGSCSPTIRQALAEHGYVYSVMWTIDTHDWKDPGVQYIANRVINNAKDGAIVLMHVGAPQTLQALPVIINWLKDKDFEFVLVDELFPLTAAADGRVPYRVRSGDTLQSLAIKFQVSEEEIQTLNTSINP